MLNATRNFTQAFEDMTAYRIKSTAHIAKVDWNSFLDYYAVALKICYIFKATEELITGKD